MNKVYHITKHQLEILSIASKTKLNRFASGWSPNYEKNPYCLHYKLVTIRSLWIRGFLDSNFNDPRVFTSEYYLYDIKNNDGATWETSQEVQKLQVWANQNGRDLLKKQYFIY